MNSHPLPALSLVLAAASVACGSSSTGNSAAAPPGDDAGQRSDARSPSDARVSDQGSPHADGGHTLADASGGNDAETLGDAATCSTTVTPSAGVVVTDRGPVQGTQESGSWSYKGIPYATPPVGALRWAPTAPHACWSDTLSASAFGAMCPQIDATNTSMVDGQEDCLTADVWTPPSAPPGSKLPMLVFIHGGGNVQGSTSEMENGGYLYDGAKMAAKENVVVVTFNYRLGALGFLAHTAFGANPGNYGTQDQIFLLHWVQRNAEAFGGDPTHVLLFGQSAGAVDTCDMVSSPLTKGTFSAALMESGACTADSSSTAQTFAQTWTQMSSCASASDVASCLRGLTADAVTLVDPQPADIAKATQGPYQPNVNGVELTGVPSDVLKSGMYNHVPLVVGSNSDETASALAKTYPNGLTESAYEAAVLSYVSNNQTLATQVLAMYPASNYASPLEAYVQVTTDAKFTTNGTYAACSASIGQTDAPVWRYFYSHHMENSTAAAGALGAWHGQELLFVFDSFSSYTPTAGEETLSATLEAYWSSLARSGTVGGSPPWPTYDASTGPYMQLDDTLQTGTGLRQSLVSFWQTALGHTCP